VENINKDILFTLKALLKEFNLPKRSWTNLLVLVQFALNNAPRKRMKGLAPVEVFLGRKPSSAFDAIFDCEADRLLENPLTAQEIYNLTEKLQLSMDQMHKDVNALVSSSRENRRKSHNNKRIVKNINFEIGDYVLVAKTQKILKDKLTVRWEGPYMCVGTVDPNIYVVQHLLKKDITIECHSSRIKLYADRTLNITESILASVMHDSDNVAVVDHIRDIRNNATTGAPELLIHWKGYDDIHDTWEPFDVMQQDIPAMVSSFLKGCKNQELASKFLFKKKGECAE
jgi:hypothetical protein